jgi:hypothetical protein
MESLPWTLRTRDPGRVRFRVRSSRTGDTSKRLCLYKGFPGYVVKPYSLSYDTVFSFQMFTKFSSFSLMTYPYNAILPTFSSYFDA